MPERYVYRLPGRLTAASLFSMPRAPQWSLVAAWTGVGALTGIALSDPFTRWILLLVPTGLAAAWLLWAVDAKRETGAALIGLSVLPTVLGIRAQDPPCQVGGEFAACDPGPAWPWVIAALVLVLAGLAIMTTPDDGLKGASRTRAGLGRVPRGQDEAVSEQELGGGSAGEFSPDRRRVPFEQLGRGSVPMNFPLPVRR